MRNSRGILIGTARSNPGKAIEKQAHLDDPVRTERCATSTTRSSTSRSTR
jgi:hypothetical protein